jgi:hypothetical protein
VADPPPTDRVPRRVIPLRFCLVSFYGDDQGGFVWTQYPGGQGWGGYPGGDQSYFALAARLGYGTDVMRYCLEHDFLHSFLCEQLYGRPSAVLYSLAHGRRHPDSTIGEEAIVQLFQGFLRAGWDMTAVAPDVDWWAIRDQARAILDG